MKYDLIKLPFELENIKPKVSTTAVQRLTMKFTQLLLTIQGSDRTDQYAGTQLVSSVLDDGISPGIAETLMNESFRQAEQQMLQITANDPEEERFERYTIDSLVIEDYSCKVAYTVYAAGDSLTANLVI